MGAGLFIATTFFALGAIINKFIPSIHSYAWMIISVAVVKALGLLPQKFEICCYQWFQFVMNNLTGVLLVGIGISYTNLTQIAQAFSPQYILLVFVTVLGAILGAGFVGRLVGFFPIDSAITAGLCMSNMGGTGDVAVLSASDRMELMPFAQISSRIGGAFILILSSILLQALL
jgi:Na+/citrate or Na+/malate symporter